MTILFLAYFDQQTGDVIMLRGRPHKRIDIVVDMKSAGVTWRPLVQISGRKEFNELFLEEVRVPAGHLLGPENGGWPLIRSALANERGTLWAFDFKVRLQNGVVALAELYRGVRDGGAGRGPDAATLRQHRRWTNLLNRMRS